MSKIKKNKSDVIVIGSGIAGLFSALEISKQFDVSLITKSELKESATWYAQGGVATAISSEDSPELHLKDTLEVGAGLCNKEAVEVLVSEAADRIGDLLSLGANFDWAGDRIGLSREGGHRLARVLHAGDKTGSEIESTLIRAVNRWKSVHVFENCFALDLLIKDGVCIGVLYKDLKSDEIVAHFSKAVILATGGVGQLYEITTSPAVCTGDGIAMAYRAGAVLTDMEFMQFHPTALDIESMPRFLITEALRGDGAYLRDCNGERFMINKHPLAELAPRDIVSREVVKAIKRCGDKPVYLDATHIPEEILRKKFPNVWENCEKHGIIISKDYIPVRPTAHYTIGGVKVDLDGKSSIEGLYAVGENSCTGVHGANRLASNSLLEGLVFGKRTANHIIKLLNSDYSEDIEQASFIYEEKRSVDHIEWNTERKWLQKLMSEHVGVTRSAQGLKYVLEQIESKEFLKQQFVSTVEAFEFINLLTISKLVTKAALLREESRGVHFREDFPESKDEWLKHIDFCITEDLLEV